MLRESNTSSLKIIKQPKLLDRVSDLMSYKNYFFTFFFVTVLTQSILTQTTNKKGSPATFLSTVIIDSVSNKPIVLANFILLRTKDSSFVSGGASRADGKIFIENVPTGSFFANVSFIGYKTKTIPNIEVKANQKELFMDTIKLKPGNILLKEVQITAEKERIIYEDDKIVFNVDKDILSLGGSAIEVLENAPLVFVDIDDNISLMGRPGTLICIDGIPIKHLGSDQKEILKTTPASDIEKVEIYIDPPIEYRNEATGGVINIIQKKETDKKYSGLIDLGANSNNNYSSSAALSYKLPNSVLRGTIGTSYDESESNSDMYRQSNLFDETAFLSFTRFSKNVGKNIFFRLNFSYMPNKENSIFQSLSYKIIGKDLRSNTTSVYTDELNNPIDSYSNNGSTNTNSKFFNYSFSYLKLFHAKGRKLSFTFSYTNNMMKLINGITKENTNIIDQPVVRQQNFSNNKNVIYFLRTHYIHPLDGGRIFQIGYNMSLKNLRLNNSYHYNKGNGYIEDLAQKNNRKYDQQNHDIFSSYNDKLWGLSYDISSKLTGMYRENLNEVLNEKYNYKYWGIFPAISIKREIFKGQRITLGWSSGVFYPDNNQINPYTDNSDSANIFKGNPDLTPEKNFNYGIGYSYINNNFNLIGGVGVWETRDIIQRYTYLENQKTSITSYKNIGKNRNYSGYVSVEKPLFDWWRLTLNVSAYKIEYSDSEYQHKAFAWGGRIQSSIHLSNFALQMNFSYSSPTITSQQNKKKETYYFDIGSKVSLFEKRLFLYLKVKDLFNSLRDNSNTYGTGFISATTKRETTRIFYIGLIFYFQDSEAPEEQIRETETTDF